MTLGTALDILMVTSGMVIFSVAHTLRHSPVMTPLMRFIGYAIGLVSVVFGSLALALGWSS